jgi:TolB-like protein/Tfp pilus assembly protein PilF
MQEKSIPSSGLIEEEFARLCESDALRRSPSHLRLLRYLVEKGIAGDESALRETAIALEVFRRDPSVYDPQVDPIVRVTIGRLRARLVAHYARYEFPPKMRIVLPKGRYAPEFVGLPVNAPMQQGLAVLDVRNDSGHADLDQHCQALVIRLTDSLARLGVPRVIARESVTIAQARTKDPQAIGRALGVEWLLDTVLASEGEFDLRATARLRSTIDDSVQWIETRAAPIADRLALFDALADRVFARFAATLKGDASEPDQLDLSALSEDERHALELARMFCRQRAVTELEQLTPEIDAITRRHPACATAWGVLASTYFTQTLRMDRDFATLCAAARTAAQRALAIDPDEANASLVLGSIMGTHDVDLEAAIAQFRRVLRRAPHYSTARHNLAVLLCYTGHFDDALAEARLARQHDPLSDLLRISSATFLSYARRHDESRREWQLLEKAGALKPSGTHPWMVAVLYGLNELWDGKFDRAEALYRTAQTLQPDSPTPVMCLGMVDAQRGDHAAAAAQKALCREKFPNMSSYYLAMLAGAMRDKTGVLRELKRARERKDHLLVSACVDPSFDWLADDEDFNGLLRSWTLPGWRGATPA